jgi:MFS family permease
MALCSAPGGRLADRLGRRWPVVAGLALLTLGLLPLALAGGAVAAPMLLGSLGAAGVGLGLSGAGMQTSAVEAVGRAETGMASGVFSTGRYLGSITGSSLLAGLLGAAGPGDPYRAIFLLVVLAAAGSALAALALRDRPGDGSPTN